MGVAGAVWGSFLNSLGYRLVREGPLSSYRSFCPSCKNTIAPYDLIPVLSWLLLSGRCRFCKTSISILYPLVELFTGLVAIILCSRFTCINQAGYFLFISALIVTMRSDTESFLISRYATLYLIPIAYSLSLLGYLPLTLYESIIGSIVGYGILWLTAKLFYTIRKKEGIGEGDFELLALIGSFLGIGGVYYALSLGSFMGCFAGILLLITHKDSQNQIILPFGLFLSLGALTYLALSLSHNSFMLNHLL